VLFTEGPREATQSLLDAQKKLIKLRELVRGRPEERSLPAARHGRSPLSAKSPTRQSPSLPEHIGWGSEPLTSLLRPSLPGHKLGNRRDQESAGQRQQLPAAHLAQCNANPASDTDLCPRLIKLYPDIALALLREQLVAPGRLWLLLRSIDQDGSGWVDLISARQRLTKKASALRVFGWRQMRKLLARGDGLFWERDRRRIWLRSPLRVAAAMGIRHLLYQPVGLPLTALLQSIGLVRAHFYASFHSGRRLHKTNAYRPVPIARATLHALCHASRRTQRTYERRAGVQKRRNFAIGKPLAVADHQNQAWERGRAVFLVTDHAGRAGPRGTTYTAWQLANSYRGPHERQPKGRQKRINRKLADLFMKGMTGNGERAHQSHLPKGDGVRRFFDNGAAAASRYNRGPDSDIYWPCRPRTAPSGGQRCELWHWLPRQGTGWQYQNRGRLGVVRGRTE
jgi:hypothetical protein